ncbi:hypothetical protein CDAR_297021 [Caerostris darwini]|uniref:Uncharacterized protein n=1 Tax=Caerostris darwini TaxID=1538125 RepID=A0AAV4QB87_9ARAC|nr:hypothetical protein CDAR_297021 [Caerostris darwini]
MNEQKSKMKRSNPSPAAEGKSRRMESSEKSSGSKGDPLKKSSEKLSSPKSKESAAKHPYKTKWEPTTSSDASVQICPPKKEEALQPPGPPVRIKDLLDNKEKIVDHLFRTVTGTALEELIPDYLKGEGESRILAPSCPRSEKAIATGNFDRIDFQSLLMHVLQLRFPVEFQFWVPLKKR